MDWTISEFGKRIGLVRERKAQLAQAEENLLSTERKVRMDVQSETRKVHRSEYRPRSRAAKASPHEPNWFASPMTGRGEDS